MTTPYLPPETLDSIVDLLQGDQNALEKCCLISKSWIPRSRRNLFAKVTFRTAKDLESWKTTFPNPSTSPAHYTKTLVIGSPHIVTAADTEVGGWVRGFSSVVELEVDEEPRKWSHSSQSDVSLLPFHGLSPGVKSLRLQFVVIPSSRVLELILSFPLLEDLSLFARDASTDNGDDSNVPPAIVHPSGLPMLTGTLELSLKGGMEHVTRRLLSLPGGIHFRKVTLKWLHIGDPSWTMILVEKCSRTLETLDITSNLSTFFRHQHPHRSLTPFSSPANRNRLFQGDGAERRRFSDRITDRRLGHGRAQNHHTRPSGFSTNHNSRAFPPRLYPCHLSTRCRRASRFWRN